MSSFNCPNCGAPKQGAVCEYCGTHFARYQGEATIEINNDDVTLYDWSGNQYVVLNESRPIITINEERYLHQDYTRF